MIELDNAKEIIIEDLMCLSDLFNYYECYLVSCQQYNQYKTVIEDAAYFFIDTPLGTSEIVGNFGTENELRHLLKCAIEPLDFDTHTILCKKKGEIISDNNKSPNVDLRLPDNVIYKCIKRIYFNSQGVSKSVKNRYYFTDAFIDKGLFCRNHICDIQMDLIAEQEFKTKSVKVGMSPFWVLAPRIVHQIVSNTFSQLIYKNDTRLIDFYLSSFGVNFRFGNLPNEMESICKNLFDIHGNDYENKIFICNGSYYGFEQSDARYEINNGNIKKGMQFSKLEIDDFGDDDYSFVYFYGFSGKIDIISNYLSGLLISTNGTITVESKLTTFFGEILGGCGRITNVKYVYDGAAPFVVKKAGKN